MWSVVVVRGEFQSQQDAARFAAGYSQLDPQHVVAVEVVRAQDADRLLEVARRLAGHAA